MWQKRVETRSPAVTPRERGKQNVAEGHWGEQMAERFLVARGMRVVERNARPCAADQRCEIDLVMATRTGGIVFVEVKTHRVRSPYASRLARVGRRKKGVLLRACANWVMHHHWHGDFRFDVVEVYATGGKGALPEIDHIENVPLFGPNWRFW